MTADDAVRQEIADARATGNHVWADQLQATLDAGGPTDKGDGRGNAMFQRSLEKCAEVNETKPPKRSPELWNYMREAEVARAKSVNVPQPRQSHALTAPRESHIQRRTGSSSSTSSADPGDPEPAEQPSAGVGR